LDCMQSSSPHSAHPVALAIRFVQLARPGLVAAGSYLVGLVRSSSGVALAEPGTMCRRACGTSARFVGRALRPGGFAGGRFGFGRRGPGLASAGFGRLALRAGFPRSLSRVAYAGGVG